MEVEDREQRPGQRRKEQLCDASLRILETIAAHGVTTVEMKSGQRMDVDTNIDGRGAASKRIAAMDRRL